LNEGKDPTATLNEYEFLIGAISRLNQLPKCQRKFYLLAIGYPELRKLRADTDEFSHAATLCRHGRDRLLT
jgi:hypothetical protein